jgi:hypothetical protein
MENLTNSRALVSDGSGDVSVSTITSTELGRLDGVTGDIQPQLNAKFRFNETTAITGFTAVNQVTYLCNSSSGAFTVDLPAAASSDFVVIKDSGGSSEGNPITIDPNAAELVDGVSTYVIESNYESVTLISDGLNWHKV